LKKQLPFFSTVKFLSKYILRHKSNFFRFYIGWLMDTILSTIMPILFGMMMDQIVYYQNIHSFMQISIIFVTMSVFSCILYFFIYAQHHYLMNMYTFDIKQDMFEHMQKCDAGYLSGAPYGKITTMIQWYPSECLHFVNRNIIHFVNGILCIVLTTVYLYIINWPIGIFVSVAAPLTVYINSKFGKKIRKCGDRQRKNYGEYSGWIFEMLTGIREIRLLGTEKRINESFADRHEALLADDLKISLSAQNASNLITFTNLCVQLGIFAFAGYAVLHSNMTIGSIIVIVTFFGYLTNHIESVSNAYLDSQKRISFVQEIYDFLNTPTEEQWPGREKLRVTEGTIDFHNISFGYEGEDEVLDGFDLKINSGERLVLVGKSGSGKTTLAYMLIGFYRPKKGWIEIDGRKISEYSLRSIRRNVGVIQQDVLLFDGTLRENILLGNPRASGGQIEQACKQAGLWKLIEELPQGLDTVIGTKGTGLSGGQKQRVEIARIYLKNPPIIIFDEATSALDSETEKGIFDAWSQVLEGRTTIMIAHRQSTVMLCERAAIIENGKIVECGKPSELAEGSRAFQSLFAIDRESADV